MTEVTEHIHRFPQTLTPHRSQVKSSCFQEKGPAQQDRNFRVSEERLGSLGSVPVGWKALKYCYTEPWIKGEREGGVYGGRGDVVVCVGMGVCVGVGGCVGMCGWMGVCWGGWQISGFMASQPQQPPKLVSWASNQDCNRKRTHVGPSWLHGLLSGIIKILLP